MHCSHKKAKDRYIHTPTFNCFECNSNILKLLEGGVSDGIKYYRLIECDECGKAYELDPETEYYEVF